MGEIQTYTSSYGDFNLLFVLVILGTYLLYEIGKAILDNNDDDDMDGGMMIRAADGAQAWIMLKKLRSYFSYQKDSLNLIHLCHRI